jgi:hypothetical protein
LFCFQKDSKQNKKKRQSSLYINFFFFLLLSSSSKHLLIGQVEDLAEHKGCALIGVVAQHEKHSSLRLFVVETLAIFGEPTVDIATLVKTPGFFLNIDGVHTPAPAPCFFCLCVGGMGKLAGRRSRFKRLTFGPKATHSILGAFLLRDSPQNVRVLLFAFAVRQ